MAMNHQNIISEKDKQLVEFKKQIESLQKTESELSKLIEEQKAKNNVSSSPTPIAQTSILLLRILPFILTNLYFFSFYKTNNFLSLPSTKTKIIINIYKNMMAFKTGFANEKLEVGWSSSIGANFINNVTKSHNKSLQFRCKFYDICYAIFFVTGEKNLLFLLLAKPYFVFTLLLIKSVTNIYIHFLWLFCIHAVFQNH